MWQRDRKKVGGGGGELTVKALKEYLFANKKEEWIAEQLIVQSEQMSKLHSASVNTVRINAYRIGKNIVIYRPFFRIGRGNRVVDNAGAGGIFMQVDADTGKTNTIGFDKYGNQYLHHPDTHILLINFQLPDWSKLICLTKEIMDINPKLGCCGWDFAHTNEGWILVEGNDSHQFVCQQISACHGCKKEMDEMLNTFLLLNK